MGKTDKQIEEEFRQRMRYAEPQRITQKDVGDITNNTAAWCNAELLRKPRRTLRNLWLNKTAEYWALGNLLGYNTVEWMEFLALPQQVSDSDDMPIYKLSTPWPHKLDEQTSKKELGKALARLGRLEQASKDIYLKDAAKIIIDADLKHSHIEKHSVVLIDYSDSTNLKYGELAFISNDSKGLLLGRYLGEDGLVQFELLSGEGVAFIDRRRVVGRCVWFGA